MLRRNRSIVNDQLPARTLVRLDTQMTVKQKELHDSALSSASQLANIARKRPLTPSEHNRMMAALQQARMACNAAGLVDKTTQGSPKLTELKNLVTEQCLEGGEKMVVFSQWKGMTSMIEAMLKQMNIGHVHLHGGVPTHKRGALMEQFSQDPNTQVFISTDAGGSGLNLQSASILVNMDVPWNPAILEQRNARIHRLGQRKKVQIILMVAENAYEQRVLQLTSKKQDLFDNVIDPEAEQDTVGISKKSLAEVLKDLDKSPDKEAAEQLEVESAEESTNEETEPQDKDELVETTTQVVTDALSEADPIADLLAAIQQKLSTRLQQVLAQQGGLLFIVDQLDQTLEDYFEQLETDIQVAVIDLRTQRQLAKLGAANPLANSEPVSLPEVIEVETENHWLIQTKKKLAAAELLAEAEQEGVIDLLIASIGTCITWLAARQQVFNEQEIPVWLYGEALTNKVLDHQQAAQLSQLLSFKMATELPTAMQQQLLSDYKSLLTSLEKQDKSQSNQDAFA